LQIKQEREKQSENRLNDAVPRLTRRPRRVRLRHQDPVRRRTQGGCLLSPPTTQLVVQVTLFLFLLLVVILTRLLTRLFICSA